MAEPLNNAGYPLRDQDEGDNIRLNGEPWMLLYTKHKKGVWGQCHHDQQMIEISRRAKGRLELDTLIHEMIHATNPWLTEEVVNETATNIAAVLWKLGYRKQ